VVAGVARVVGETEQSKEGFNMRKTIAALVVAASLAPAVPARAQDPGQEILFSSLALLANIGYTPAKVIVATGGLVVGALAGTFNGGDARAAYAFWVPAAGGRYFLTSDQMDGRVPVEFFGSDYADRPGTYGHDAYASGVYDSMYKGPVAKP
jgi:hypothetical protein